MNGSGSGSGSDHDQGQGQGLPIRWGRSKRCHSDEAASAKLQCALSFTDCRLPHLCSSLELAFSISLAVEALRDLDCAVSTSILKVLPLLCLLNKALPPQNLCGTSAPACSHLGSLGLVLLQQASREARQICSSLVKQGAESFHLTFCYQAPVALFGEPPALLLPCRCFATGTRTSYLAASAPGSGAIRHPCPYGRRTASRRSMAARSHGALVWP
mmetsp:Transcript_27723/g.60634  ORF Transcript_27723/g.60634 Transcript_27723/m.60634 type:complete len:215 (-) Transcript_27723:18-662(-)